jgi:hypothetical protein
MSPSIESEVRARLEDMVIFQACAHPMDAKAAKSPLACWDCAVEEIIRLRSRLKKYEPEAYCLDGADAGGAYA